MFLQLDDQGPRYLQLSRALKQAILGLTKPAQNLGSAGTLQGIAKQYGYSNYGIGFVDFVKLTERLSSPPTGTDAQFAKALDIPFAGVDPACRTDYLDIAHKFPRFVGGVEELSAQRVRIGAQMEIDGSIAQDLVRDDPAMQSVIPRLLDEANSIGHFGFFRRPQRETLWPKAADWLFAS